MTQKLIIKVGDSFEVLKTFEEGSVGAIVTDPPYKISFMSKSWDSVDSGKTQEWNEGWLKECFRVLRPGGVIKSFSSTRTFHRLAAAMENVGFVLDPKTSIEAWVYGCLSEDTEILTRDGWKLGLDTQVGDIVACWDPKTDTQVFHPVKQVTKAPFEGSLVRLIGEGTDQLVTPNHRVYFRDYDGWDVAEAGDLLGTGPTDIPLEAGKTTSVVGELYDYKGMVWCVQVPTGAFFARRMGKVFISSNSGFPKSLSVSKALDAHFGKERAVVGYDASKVRPNKENFAKRTDRQPTAGAAEGWKDNGATVTAPATPEATPEATKYSGFGTALKPSFEPFICGTKPEC